MLILVASQRPPRTAPSVQSEWPTMVPNVTTQTLQPASVERTGRETDLCAAASAMVEI